METIKAYKTSDGQIHATKREATVAEFGITIQGIFNRNGTRTQTVFTPREVATVIHKNLDEVRKVLSKYSNTIKNLNNQSKKEFTMSLH